MTESRHPTGTLYRAEYVYTGGDLRRNGLLGVSADGLVVAPSDLTPTADVKDLGAVLIAPGMVNTHSHAFQVLLRGRSEQSKSFRDWVDHALYPLVERMTPELVFDSAVLAFGEMLLEGVTSVGEFFYLNRLPSGDGAARILSAAERVGIRICLLRSLYDRQRRAAQARFCEPVEEAVESARQLGLNAKQRGHGYGIAPHSLHGASAEMIQRGHSLAVELNCPLHIHVAEQRGDLKVSEEIYGTTPLRALERLGIVDERMTCVHGVWLDPEETRLLGARGASLAYNPRSNMALGDGIAPIRELLEAGVRVSLGIDGPGANNQAGILHEVRAAEGLQRLRHEEMNQIPGFGGQAPDPGVLMDMATRNGAQNLGLNTGGLAPGEWADFLVVDINDPSMWPWLEEEPETLLWNFLLSSAPRACIRHVYVGGKQVVRDGSLATLNFEEAIGGRRALSSRMRGE